MYRVCLEVSKAGETSRVNLFQHERFSTCLEKAWAYIHQSGVPASQIDILAKDESTGLYLSVWADIFDWKNEGGAK